MAIENPLEMDVLMVKSSINGGSNGKVTMFDFSDSLGGYGWMMFGRKPSIFELPSYPHLSDFQPLQDGVFGQFRCHEPPFQSCSIHS